MAVETMSEQWTCYESELSGKGSLWFVVAHPHGSPDVRVGECYSAANAALIVRAVNEREEQLAALRALVDDYELVIGDGVTEDTQPAVLCEAKAVLAKADTP